MIHWTSPLSIAVAFWAAASGSLSAQTDVALKIHAAIEVEYQTQIGKSYQLQGTTDLSAWTDIGNPVLGHGRAVDQIFSTKDSVASAYANYRVVVSDGPANGFAPWTLAGAQISMGDGSSNRYVEYGADDLGHDHFASGDDVFTYEYTRLNQNEARIDSFYTPDRHETVYYAYTGSGVGTWVRDEFRQDALERHGSGVFRYLADTTNAVAGVTNKPVLISPALPPTPPTNVNGLTYYVLSGGNPDQLEFKSGNSGIEMPVPSLFRDGSEQEVTPGGNAFSYSYQINDNRSASLKVNFGYYGFGGDKNEYDLTYTDGPSGTFVRRIYRLGSLTATDSGAFSPYAPAPVTPVVPGDGGTSIPSANPPPTSPLGLTYTFQDRSTPSRFNFQSSVAGVEFDDSAPSNFTYTYISSDANHFKLMAQYKADKRDEYDLTFTSGNQGTAVHREFKAGKLYRTSKGSFKVTRSAP